MPLLFYLTLAFIFGIITQATFNFPLVFLITLLVFFSLSLFLGSLRNYFPFFLSLTLVILLFFLSGAIDAAVKSALFQKSLLVKFAKDKRLVTVEGEVISEPQFKRGRISFTFKVRNARSASKLWQTYEFTQVIIEGRKSFVLGDSLKFSGIPQFPKKSKNFDYRSYLARREIFTIFFLKNTEVTVVSSKSNYFHSLRQRLKSNIVSNLRPPLGGLLLALLLGDTRFVPEEVKISFERSGVLHLFAVSGLNVTLLALFFLFLGRILRIPKAAVMVASIGGVLFYLSLTGFSPSVYRAGIMSLAAIFAWLFAQKVDLFASLSLAALLLLAYNPFLLYEISFQLSFAAVLGIFLITPRLLDLCEKELKKMMTPLAVTLGAQLAVVPILAYWFNQISLVSITANLVLVPPVAFLTGVGFLGMAFSLFWPSLAAVFFNLLFPGLLFLEKGAAFFAHLPGAYFYLPRPTFLQITLYFLALFALLSYARRLSKKANFAIILIFTLLFLALGIWSQVFIGSAPSELVVTFLDVGEGDATLVQSQEGKIILVDGGESFEILEKHLASKGIRKVDLLVLSHAHADHVGGLVKLIKNYSVGIILDPGYPHPSFLYKEFLEIVTQKEIPYQLGRAGNRYEIGSDLVLNILFPREPFIEGTSSDVNNNSIVTRFKYKKFSLFLPGDIEEEAVSALLKKEKGKLNSTVFKVAHHGSFSGISPPLLKEIKPEVAVISVGKGNPYGHPHASTLRLLKKLGIRFYRTDIDGNIFLSTDGSRYKIYTQY